MEDVTAEEELTLVKMLYVDSCVRSVSLSLSVCMVSYALCR